MAACSEYAYLTDAIAQFAFRDAFTCAFAQSMGGFALAGFLLIAFPTSAVYIRTESMSHVAIILLLIGGIVSPMMLPIGANITGIMIMLAVGILPVFLLWRINRN